MYKNKLFNLLFYDFKIYWHTNCKTHHMKQLILIIIVFFLGLSIRAQQEFHVFPNGKATGNGSLQKPWDLQTALSQKPDVINGGDTIWLHEGIYNGRFLSTIKSTKKNSFIIVAPFNQEKVVLNGNVDSNKEAVLNVTSSQVIFRDFEITWLGEFSRNEADKYFRKSAGIFHTSGEDCRFYNLVIHDNPGLGFGSWKQTGGTIIQDCIFNGWMSKDGKGRGEGMYVQNASEKIRLIKNNIIFANYYKGIEVWSAGRDAKLDFVKNVTLEDNVIFNSGSPSGEFRDNVIIATDDRSGTNFAKNIKVLNNIFYHTTDYLKNEVNGDAPSLTLGYTKKAPVMNIVVKGNIILGRNNALRLLHVKSMTFEDNVIYGGYVFLNAITMPNSNNWTMENNKYFTKKTAAYRVDQDKTYNLKDWHSTFNLDLDSQWKHIKDFDLKDVLRISENATKSNSFKVVLFNKKGNDVKVDFSKYNIPKGSSYKIYDVENRKKIAASGIIPKDKIISFPMGLPTFQLPLNNMLAQKSASNFGVFVIAFEVQNRTSNQ